MSALGEGGRGRCGMAWHGTDDLLVLSSTLSLPQAVLRTGVGIRVGDET